MPTKLPMGEDVVARLRARLPETARALAELDTRFAPTPPSCDALERPVYVTGLARAGTTILTEALATTPRMATHRYLDRPIPHAPFLWRRIVRSFTKTTRKSQPRAHSDRLTVSLESPENAEEPLWRETFPHEPLTAPPTQNDTFSHFYRKHVAKMIALEGGHRYLAKATEHAGRLPYLINLFAAPAVVAVVREPTAHVASLMTQHKRFTAWAAHSRQLASHLAALGHTEFGPARRPPIAADPATQQQIKACWAAGEEARGWALAWRAVVIKILEARRRYPNNVKILCAESLCQSPISWLDALGCWLDMPSEERRMLVAFGASNISHQKSSEPLSRSDADTVIAETADIAHACTA